MLLRRSSVSVAVLTHVMATVRSMAEPERSWTGQFRINARSVDCVVPRSHLENIGLEVVATRIYEPGNRVDVTTGRIEFMGEIVGATIAMGDDGGDTVLGMTVLECLGVEARPGNQWS